MSMRGLGVLVFAASTMGASRVGAECRLPPACAVPRSAAPSVRVPSPTIRFGSRSETCRHGALATVRLEYPDGSPYADEHGDLTIRTVRGEGGSGAVFAGRGVAHLC